MIVSKFKNVSGLSILAFCLYYMHGSVRAIPTYRVYQLYDMNNNSTFHCVLLQGVHKLDYASHIISACMMVLTTTVAILWYKHACDSCTICNKHAFHT